MAKKNGALGKLIAFTTAAAAIGGVCYVFRDKIKENPVFKSASDKANDIYDSVKTKISRDDDEFFFDDDDFFDDESDDFADFKTTSNEREYTSISSKQSAETSTNDESDDISTSESDSNSDSIPTIDFGNTASSTDNKENKESDIPTAYENEGLSDVSEDPDVLEDMDKLDN